MKKLVLFMHVSLDGFVAGPNGEMDWIKVDDEMFDYAGKQTDQSDTALYGRVTYQMMENYWPAAGEQPNATKHDKQHSAWYNQVPKYVLSKTLKEEKLVNTFIISDNVTDQVKQLKQGAGKDIVMFGSPSAAHTLMAENLIDVYWLFVNPILVGEGIPLFKKINHKTNLNLLSTATFPSGVVCLHYTL
ncbi:MAG TPA: dihydrofolate reductase family protein [Chitinophagaceae bacterium]